MDMPFTNTPITSLLLVMTPKEQVWLFFFFFFACEETEAREVRGLGESRCQEGPDPESPIPDLQFSISKPVILGLYILRWIINSSYKEQKMDRVLG